jgi:lipoprotein signal peptidase
MKKFILFLTLDLASKYLAAVIAPNNTILKLAYNKHLAFSYDGGHFMTYILPFLLIPIMIVGLVRVSPRSIPIILAGMIGNLFCRFLPCGVVDFINLQKAICNFADIYMWIGAGILFLDSYKRYAQKRMVTTVDYQPHKEIL